MYVKGNLHTAHRELWKNGHYKEALRAIYAWLAVSARKPCAVACEPQYRTADIGIRGSVVKKRNNAAVLRAQAHSPRVIDHVMTCLRREISFAR